MEQYIAHVISTIKVEKETQLFYWNYKSSDINIENMNQILFF